MRRTKRTGGFILCLLLNMLLNLDGLLPAAVLLALHFAFGLSMIFALLALALWLTYIIVCISLIRWGRHCSNIKEIERENKNPYSQKSERNK